MNKSIDIKKGNRIEMTATKLQVFPGPSPSPYLKFNFRFGLYLASNLTRTM